MWSERDFWMFEVESWEKVATTEITYHRGLRILHGLCAMATKRFVDPQHRADLAVKIPTLTWHSCRVTLLSAAVHAGVDALPISMQANHANTDLIVKYTRDRCTLPLKMVGQLLQDLRSSWQPTGSTALVAADEEDHFSADEEDDCAPIFYVKRSKVTTRTILTQKFHVTARDNLALLACNKVQVAECDPIGSELPDISVLCASCRKARSDLFEAGSA